ncbi:MAG: hypothetical protein IT384_12950 [Deltaproteobacteria bacterium]|nr:hypothetical protein [Deltaproteobacteria bacterium]
MSFPWMEASIPESFRATFPEKAQEMLRRGIRDQAQILRSLGYGRDYAVVRCRLNLSWEFELLPKPKVAEEVERLVDQVYKSA